MSGFRGPLCQGSEGSGGSRTERLLLTQSTKNESRGKKRAEVPRRPAARFPAPPRTVPCHLKRQCGAVRWPWYPSAPTALGVPEAYPPIPLPKRSPVTGSAVHDHPAPERGPGTLYTDLSRPRSLSPSPGRAR